MTGQSRMSPAAFALSLLLARLDLSSAQNCYYPDGSLSTEGDAACSSQGGACCPLNWQCMSNGLCYLANAGYYGRYTCTDQTWQSPDCPQICTQGNTASGNEAMLQCDSGDWCCDGNRVAFNCCTKADTDYFKLPSPSPIAFISSVPSPTSAKSVHNSPATDGNALPNSSSPPQGSSAPPSSSAAQMTASGGAGTANNGAGTTTNGGGSGASSTSMTKVTHTSVTTGADGSQSTVTKVVTSPAVSAAAASNNNNDQHNSHSSNLPLIVGLAVGIPLFLIIVAISLFFFVKHMRASNKYHNAPRRNTPPMEANYSNLAPGSHAPEIDSYPVAPGRTKSGRKSELYGSDPVPKSPALSTGTNGSVPPQYSPQRTEPMSQIQEEPQELWGGYVPYRPPNSAQAAGRDINKMP